MTAVPTKGTSLYFIDPDTCYALGERLAKSSYGQYVMDVARSLGAAARDGGS